MPGKPSIRSATALLSALLGIFSACAGVARAQLAPNPTTYPSEQPSLILGPAPGEKFTDLSSGKFTYSKTDLALPGSMPIQIARVYQSRDYNSSGFLAHSFGLGTRLNYDVFLYPGPNNSAEVVMPSGGEINCGCTDTQNGCQNYPTATYACSSQPTGVWFDSTITYNNGWDLRRKDGTVYHFGNAAPLQSITDRFGNAITITRGGTEASICASPGKAISPSDIATVSSSDGRSVDFCYDDPNYAHGVSKIADNTGTKVVDYTYDTSGYDTLKTVTRTSFNSYAVTKYNYGAKSSGNLGDIQSIVVNVQCTSATSCSQNYTYITYGGSPGYRVTSVSPSTPSAGYQYSYSLDSTNTYVQEVHITYPDTYARNLYFDSLGYLTEDARHPSASNAEVTLFTRGPGDLVTSVSEENGSSSVLRNTQYGWDPSGDGDLTSVTVSPGPGTGSSATWGYTYEPVYHRLASFSEPLSNKPTTISYSDSTDQYSIADPLGRTTTVSYNAQGQTTSVKDPLGNTSTMTYDGYGDVASSTDPAGDTTQYVVDQVGRVTDVISPLNEDTHYVYGEGDHVTERDDPKVSAGTPRTLYAYDLVGDITSVTTPNGNVTTYTRPATLNSVTITDPLGGKSVINFDADGRSQTYTDYRGDVTTYSYDTFGRLTSFSSQSANTCTINAGVAAYTVPADTRSTSFTYDALDRVTQITNSVSVYPTTCSAGTVAQTSQFNYTYDGIDDVMSESQTTTNGTAMQPPSTVAYQYDLNGRRTSMQATINNTPQPAVNYVYDCDDELVEMSNGGPLTVSSCGPSNYVAGSYADQGAQVGVSYDNDGRRIGLNVGSVLTTYAYDPASRLTSLAYSNPGAGTQYGNLTYQYDKDSQMYDEGGSLAAIGTPASATASYSAIDQVATWNGAAATVDKNGNIIGDPSGNGETYTWDVRNALMEANGFASPILYDNRARREDRPSVTVQSGNATAYFPGEEYSYDGSQVIQSTNDVSTLPTDYLRMPGSGEMLMESPPSADAEVPLIDGAGSTIAMVDAVTGAISSQYTYDPLGGVTVSGTGYQTEYQYLGMENDGFAYYGGNRYYSPVMGRFLSLSGPLSSAGGFGSGVGPVAAAMGATSSNGGGGVPGVPDVPFYVPAPAFYGPAGMAAGYFAGELITSATLGDTVGGPPGAVIGFLAGFFTSLFSGGSSGPPGWIIWKETHTGNVAMQVQKSGINQALAMSWLPTARIQLVGDNTPPLQNQQAREPVCEGNWKCIKESTTTASPLGDDARTGSALNNCTCYWACVACNGSVDLYNSYLDRLKTFGIAIQATNGEGCVAPYPGSETACPAK
jgi:YD repeat-containing protein